MPYKDICSIDWILRHAIVPNYMIPRPRVPRRALHKVRWKDVEWLWIVYVDFEWKESGWVRSQESLVRPFSSVTQTEELSSEFRDIRLAGQSSNTSIAEPLVNNKPASILVILGLTIGKACDAATPEPSCTQSSTCAWELDYSVFGQRE